MSFGQSALVGLIAGEITGMIADLCNVNTKHKSMRKAIQSVAGMITNNEEDAEKALQFMAENKNFLQAGAALTVGGIVAVATIDSIGGGLVAVEAVMYTGGASPAVVVNSLIALLESLTAGRVADDETP
jgi:hypothetical protein